MVSNEDALSFLEKNSVYANRWLSAHPDWRVWLGERIHTPVDTNQIDQLLLPISQDLDNGALDEAALREVVHRAVAAALAEARRSADNVLRHGTPALSKRFFRRLKSTFGEACEVLTVTTPEGKPLSSVLSFYFRDEVLPYYAGDDLAARDLAANDFKYWELMRRACERGCKVFDYGRSKVGTGPYSFKKNWGFEPQPLNYEYVLLKRDVIPQNNPLNPKYRALIALWRKLPRAVMTKCW